MEEEIIDVNIKMKESKLETLSRIIKRKDSRIKMLSQISKNSTLIRLNLLVSAQERRIAVQENSLSNNVETEQSVQESEEKIELEKFVSNFEINNENPAPSTLQATNDETPSVEDFCENFDLNDVDLDYSDADYQNLTTFIQDLHDQLHLSNTKVST